VTTTTPTRLPAAITVTVTPGDIRAGERRSPWRDPVCVAVCRMLGTTVATLMADARASIDGGGLDIWPEPGTPGWQDATTYVLPDEAIAWLEAFDAGGPDAVAPVTFTARLMEDL
jgi:hypothetical protein